MVGRLAGERRVGIERQRDRGKAHLRQRRIGEQHARQHPHIGGLPVAGDVLRLSVGRKREITRLRASFHQHKF